MAFSKVFEFFSARFPDLFIFQQKPFKGSKPIFFLKDGTYAFTLNCLYQECKKLPLREILKLLMSIRGKMGHVANDCVLKKSLNGGVVVFPRKGQVFKYANCYLEPDFLENELMASQLYCELVPKILETGNDNNNFYLVSQYIKSKNIISWESWQKKCTPILSMLVRKDGFQAISSQEYYDTICRAFQDVERKGSLLFDEFQSCKNLLMRLLNSYFIETVTFRRFSHGDLTPNNVLENDGNYYIIDWANGGWKNMFYDLMVEDLYFPDSISWKEFAKMNFSSSTDAKVFWGLSSVYLSAIKRELGISFSDKEIKFGLLISLCEKCLSSFTRHQSASFFNDGKDILHILHKIALNICQARE